jgi:hypothetical protein
MPSPPSTMFRTRRMRVPLLLRRAARVQPQNPTQMPVRSATPGSVFTSSLRPTTDLSRCSSSCLSPPTPPSASAPQAPVPMSMRTDYTLSPKARTATRRSTIN